MTKPGHFVMVKPPNGERAAVALGVYEAQGDRASIMFVACGSRTRELAAVAVGQTLELFGPLGNGFTLPENLQNVAIVAGGVGIASVLLPAQALVAAGCRVRLFYGARTAELLVDAHKFERSGCEVRTATDDGSAGHHGYVTDLLRSAADKPELILACGPSPMLRAVSKVAREIDVRAQLSLEETFACGVGACWGCVVPLDRASQQAPGFPLLSTDGNRHASVYARICKEGPVFWAHELRW
ncbi:MAG: dihydroorotate dehydrogenase electron transfer subunit [Candidatus Eremiobacteraeota bacterium]|nr:dihydroorotate dehydrogenase electron transfer subunit [Candidatus Eremiobacteraeota bacterium]